MSRLGGAYYGVEQVGHLYFFGSALQMAHSTVAMVADIRKVNDWSPPSR
jgi:hypothetical protein